MTINNDRQAFSGFKYTEFLLLLNSGKILGPVYCKYQLRSKRKSPLETGPSGGFFFLWGNLPHVW
jgi:hypothetical protein